jgi:hypothetical protein
MDEQPKGKTTMEANRADGHANRNTDDTLKRSLHGGEEGKS